VGRKKTHEEYEQELFEKEIDYQPIERYINDKTPILHECIEGHQWLVCPSNVLQRQSCSICDKNKRTKSNEEYLQDLLDAAIVYKPLEPYINKRTKILHECPEGHTWNATPSSVLTGKQNCPTCVNLSRPGGYNTTRFNRDRDLAESPGLLYIIVLVNKKTSIRECVKIGITKGTSNKDVLKRSRGFTGYEPRIQKEIAGTLEEVFNLEQYLHKKWQNFRYLDSHKFGGYSELFQIEKLPEILKSIPTKV